MKQTSHELLRLIENIVFVKTHTGVTFHAVNRPVCFEWPSLCMQHCLLLRKSNQQQTHARYWSRASYTSMPLGRYFSTIWKPVLKTLFHTIRKLQIVSSSVANLSSSVTHLSSSVTHLSSSVTHVSSSVTHVSSRVTLLSSSVTNGRHRCFHFVLTITKPSQPSLSCGGRTQNITQNMNCVIRHQHGELLSIRLSCK